MMTILYEVEKKLYVNITNKCGCACVFCIRKNDDGVYGSDSLWLEREPSLDEIIEEFEKRDLNKYEEIVFCGYGEPLERLDIIISTCEYLKKINAPKIRINTNGLADLIYNYDVADKLKGLVDIISISLNAGTSESYLKITNSSYGEKSFETLLKFAENCKKHIPKVIFTLVDVISKEEIEIAKKLSENMGIELRIRAYEK